MAPEGYWCDGRVSSSVYDCTTLVNDLTLFLTDVYSLLLLVCSLLSGTLLAVISPRRRWSTRRVCNKNRKRNAGSSLVLSSPRHKSHITACFFIWQIVVVWMFSRPFVFSPPLTHCCLRLCHYYSCGISQPSQLILSDFWENPCR